MTLKDHSSHQKPLYVALLMEKLFAFRMEFRTSDGCSMFHMKERKSPQSMGTADERSKEQEDIAKAQEPEQQQP